jgi:uridine kinase
MLARRINRDAKERGRSVDGILDQYAFSVSISPDIHQNAQVPSIREAVVRQLCATHLCACRYCKVSSLLLVFFFYLSLQIVPGSNNSVAIELITTHIRRKLQDRSNQFREKMCAPKVTPRSPSAVVDADILGLTVLPETNQLKVGLVWP